MLDPFRGRVRRNPGASIETFAPEVLEQSDPVEELFIAEAVVPL
jgi:hypothetical protein